MLKATFIIMQRSAMDLEHPVQGVQGCGGLNYIVICLNWETK